MVNREVNVHVPRPPYHDALIHVRSLLRSTDSNGRYPPYSPTHRRSLDNPHRHTASSPTPYSPYDSPRDDSAYGFVASDSMPIGHVPAISSFSLNGTHQTPLFDPEHPQRPHATLMHYIQLFFEHLSAEFPFMSYEDIVAQFYNQSLPPFLSSCIASLSVRCVLMAVKPEADIDLIDGADTPMLLSWLCEAFIMLLIFTGITRR
jgi:hypothetical protein